jgi:uncharacterized protein (TIGR02246 family)
MSAARGIQQVVEALAGAWNSRDWDAFGRLFAEDADYVTGAGVHLAGRTRIRDTLKTRAADTIESDQVTLTTESTRMLGPDAAVVLCAWRLGAEPVDRAGLLTVVMQHADEGWRIIALHNTDTTHKPWRSA